MKKMPFKLAGKACELYTPDADSQEAELLFIQAVDDHDAEGLPVMLEIMNQQIEQPFVFADFYVGDWNADLTPWDAPPVFGKEGFGHGAADTLAFVSGTFIPEVRARAGLSETTPIVVGGYSLAGLFALWCAYQTDAFAAVMAASPSVWFPGWRDYSDAHAPKAPAIYLSLGDKEEKTRNQVMAQVGDNIRHQYDVLKQNESVDSCTLAWHPGNHFKDPEKRCAAGYIWCAEALTK